MEGDARVLLCALESIAWRYLVGQLVYARRMTSGERPTWFRNCTLRVAWLLRLAQQAHPLTDKLAHTGKVLHPRTAVSE